MRRARLSAMLAQIQFLWQWQHHTRWAKVVLDLDEVPPSPEFGALD